MILPGMFPAGAAAGSQVPSGLTFLGIAGNLSNASSYAFGVPDDTSTERRIIVASCTRQTAERSITGVTIGGSVADIHLNLNSASTSNDTDLVIVSRLVPAGDDSDIVVSCSSTMDACFVCAWRLDGETSSSPHHTASDTVLSGATLSAAIDIPENGAIIAMQCAAPTSGAINFSGIDKDASSVTAALTVAAGSLSELSAEAGHTVQGSHTGDVVAANTALLGVISWQYA